MMMMMMMMITHDAQPTNYKQNNIVLDGEPSIGFDPWVCPSSANVSVTLTLTFESIT